MKSFFQLRDSTIVEGESIVSPEKTSVVEEGLQEVVSVKKEKHSWGTMMTVHHGSDTSYPLHPEHQSAIKKLRPGMKTTFKDETNSTVHAHREGDTVHLTRPKSGSTLTSLPYHHFDTSEHAKPAAKKPAGEYDRKVTAHLKKKYNEDIDFNEIWNNIKPVEEEIKTTHEDPLVVTRDSEGHIHTHANLSVANAIHGTNVKHQAIHTGKPVQAGKFTFELSKHHEGALKEAEDPREYDYEGDMSKSQLRSIIANAQAVHDMLKDDTNMAEWVQSKITLSADYISTVRDYMMSETNEEVKPIEELKSTTLDSYISKVASGPSRGKTQTGLLKSIKAIGGVTTALRKKAENNMKEDAPFDTVAHKKETDRLMTKHMNAHAETTRLIKAKASQEEINKAQERNNAIKGEIRAHKDKAPKGPAPKQGSAAHYYASKKPGEYTGD